MINQISGMANEGKHLLVYFHNRQGQIKLFLSKFYFIVKNNHPYTVGLKNEKVRKSPFLCDNNSS